MNTRSIFSLAGCALAATCLSCHKTIKVAASYVNPGLQVTPYVYSGGRLLWWSDTSAFTIHFITPIPCEGKYVNDIPGSPGLPAVCDIPSASSGEYGYQILAAGEVVKGIDAEGNPPPIWVKTDSKPCKGCDGVMGGGKRKKRNPKPEPAPKPEPLAKAQSGPPTTHIYCEAPGKKAVAIPTTVEAHPGDAVGWTQAGSDTLKWTATFADTRVCSKVTAFSTAGPTFCSVNSSFDFGGSSYLDFTYNVTLSDGGCTAGTATLRVLKPSEVSK